MLPKNRAPTHPGEILLEEFLKPLNLSQGQFVCHLGGSWTQPKISEIINKKRRITESIALDFADALGTSPEFWLNLQIRYDLWHALKLHKKNTRFASTKSDGNLEKSPWSIEPRALIDGFSLLAFLGKDDIFHNSRLPSDL